MIKAIILALYFLPQTSAKTTPLRDGYTAQGQPLPSPRIMGNPLSCHVYVKGKGWIKSDTACQITSVTVHHEDGRNDEGFTVPANWKCSIVSSGANGGGGIIEMMGIICLEPKETK
jgi:hypothetical protein